MSDIAIQGNGDLDLTGHRLRLATGADAIDQQIQIRLRFFLGEWFLDQRVGIPYYREILIKDPNLLLVESMFRQTIRTTPGVTEVTHLSATVDKAARRLNLSFAATLDTGEILEYSPFVLEL